MGKRQEYIVINLNNFDVTDCNSKVELAGMIGMHRNSIPTSQDRFTKGNFLIIPKK
jgi:hypothetical protein